MLSDFVNRWHVTLQNASHLMQRVCRDFGLELCLTLKQCLLERGIECTDDGEMFGSMLQGAKDREEERIRDTMLLFFPRTDTNHTCVPLFVLPIFASKCVGTNEANVRFQEQVLRLCHPYLVGQRVQEQDPLSVEARALDMQTTCQGVLINYLVRQSLPKDLRPKLATAQPLPQSPPEQASASSSSSSQDEDDTYEDRPEHVDDEMLLTRAQQKLKRREKRAQVFGHLIYPGSNDLAFPGSKKDPIHIHVAKPQERTVAAALTRAVQEHNLQVVIHCQKMDQGVRNTIFHYRKQLPQFLIYYIEDMAGPTAAAAAATRSPSSRATSPTGIEPSGSPVKKTPPSSATKRKQPDDDDSAAAAVTRPDCRTRKKLTYDEPLMAAAAATATGDVQKK